MYERTIEQEGSSPHTRGAPRLAQARLCRKRIIPAYAGSTATALSFLRLTQDHPRIRGEHIQKQSADSTGKGSSPHTRGALAGRELQLGGHRIIPAYAGSTDFPSRTARPGPGSSPHTRGALGPAPGALQRERIIPAYAGSTESEVHGPCPCPDHPRIRGEHVIPSRNVNGVTGSSPHTRGALDQIDRPH